MLRYTDNKVCTLFINFNYKLIQQYALFVDVNTVNFDMEYTLQHLALHKNLPKFVSSVLLVHLMKYDTVSLMISPLQFKTALNLCVYGHFRHLWVAFSSSLHKGQFSPPLPSNITYHNSCPCGM